MVCRNWFVGISTSGIPTMSTGIVFGMSVLKLMIEVKPV